jgi:hypothetical protein
VTGAKRSASFRMDDDSAPLEKLADETQRGEIELKPMKRLEIRQGGRTVAGYDVNWIVDRPPTITTPGAPTEAPRWRLRIDYRASDDYGIESVTGQMVKADKVGGDTPPFEFPVAVPAGAGKTFVHASMQDLASHPWAGQRVYMKLIARDQAGQSKALNKMQQSMAQAQEQLMQSLFEKGLGGAIELPGAGQMTFSPLGARDGRRNGEHVDVPTGPDTQGMAQRVRVILEEIRARAADRTRPEAEQDYLRRLMKQF